MVNIKGLNKHHLLQLMCSNQNIVTMFWGLCQTDTPEPERELKFVDYHMGVKICIDFRDDEVNSFVYNRDAGQDNKLEKIVECMRELMQEEEAEEAEEAEEEYPEYMLERSESEEEKELEEYKNDQNYQNNSHYINGQYMDNDEMCDYYKSLDIWDKM